MTTVPFTHVAHLLAVDTKTLRQWIKQSNLELSQSPTDARVKCLTSEQVHLLASLHGRVLPLPAEPSAGSPRPGEVGSQTSPAIREVPGLREKLMQLEAEFATQQEQIAALSLQLLREREQRMEHRLLTLETLLTSTGVSLLQPQIPSLPSQPDGLKAIPNPREEQRARLIPLIEYSSSGSYVLICPKEGELHLIPDTPEWFAWLASLSSFRFVGQSGRLSARRGSSPRCHHSWYARRVIHQRDYCKYLGANHHVTIARLEHIAAIFENYAS